jgi:hypothetical protein
MEQKQLTPKRRRVLEFLGAVAAVHVVAIALYYGLDLAQAVPSTQRRFAWGWMAVTVAVVVLGLQRLKRARRVGGESR